MTDKTRVLTLRLTGDEVAALDQAAARLGANRADVLRLVVLQGMRPAILGLAIGLAGALILGRLLSSMIFGVRATDPVTFGGVSLFLAAVALLASYVPALRASRIDPAASLKSE